MKRFIICLITLGFGLAGLRAQSGIDYRPRLLLKELGNLHALSNPVLVEVSLPEPLASQVYPGKFFRIDHASGGTSPGYVYLGRVYSCRTGGCSGNPEKVSGQVGEYFDYFVLFNALGTVELVRVFNYQATHGEAITAPGWLRQFNGYSGETTLNAGKNIDGISGATISVKGITTDIQHKTRLLKQVVF